MRLQSLFLGLAVLALAACSGPSAVPDAGGGNTAAAPSGTSGGGSTSAGGSSGSGSSASASSASTGVNSGPCLTSCGSGSGSSGGTGSETSGGQGPSGGSSGGSSSGGNGGGCVVAGGNCALANCCAGLSCDLGSDSCVAATADAGSSCGLRGDGGSCLSIADCAAPFVCNVSGPSATFNAGVCGPPGPAPSLQCTPNGHSCGPSQPVCCGGSCIASICTPRPACALLEAPCANDADCCSGLGCTGIGAAPDGGDGGGDGGGALGLCAPACGGELDPCQNSSDCCTEKGLFCLPTSPNVGSFCYPELPTQPADPTLGGPLHCAGACSSFECQLGASCLPTTDPVTGAYLDPCGQAGLVCDATSAVCRAPGEFDACKPGGAACQPIADSTADDLQCVQVSLLQGDPFVCVQPCTQTTDCVDPLMTCQQDGTLGSFCFYSICQSYFAACPSSGTNDGLCIPYLDGASTLGLCEQAALSGGETGSACLGGNRQVGGLCGVQDFCVDGLCSPVCNAGTSGVPSCAGATPDGGDGGAAGASCVAVLGQTGNTDNLGSCSLACDFTSDAGGGCVAPDGGAPEKCLPQFLFGLADVPTGLCVLGPASGLAVGQPCDGAASSDGCVAGALCLFDGFAGTFCAQLCDRPDGPGGGCAPGQTCVGFVSGGIESSSTGYCATTLPDGGQAF